jgi:uncharacterized protein YndB with AHSA1/START domain
LQDDAGKERHLRSIEQSIEIEAPVERVWDVLTTTQLIRHWGSAFLPGIRAESDWKPGSGVFWRREDGKLAIIGTIAEIEPCSRLKVAYPPDLNTEVPDPETDFVETYTLETTDEGVKLTVCCGPLHLVDMDTMEPKWNEALSAIKDLAEQGSVKASAA